MESPNGYQSYFEKELSPWRHYIPVKSDLSDLEANVDFAVSNENEAKVRKIVDRAQSWCRNKLVKDQLATDFLWILVSYLELLNANGRDWLDLWRANENAYNLEALNMQEFVTI